MTSAEAYQKMYGFFEVLRARFPEFAKATPERAAELAREKLDEVMSYTSVDGRAPLPGEQFDDHEALRRITLYRQGAY